MISLVRTIILTYDTEVRFSYCLLDSIKMASLLSFAVFEIVHFPKGMFYCPPTLVEGDYLNWFIRSSFRSRVRPSLDTMRWVPYGRNPSYSFEPICPTLQEFLSWSEDVHLVFGLYSLYIFFIFFHFFNLVFFQVRLL